MNNIKTPSNQTKNNSEQYTEKPHIVPLYMQSASSSSADDISECNACESTCMQTCKQACQGGCQAGCQESCKQSCQSTCEAGEIV